MNALPDTLLADPSSPRRRLLDALAEVVARQGYADTTIADIAAQARVSKRTFYEHFETKADALFALYQAASAQAMLALTDALDPQADWRSQVDKAVHAYLSTLACNPPLLRTLFIEILHLGPEGLRVRRQVNEQIASFIVRTVSTRCAPSPMLHTMAMAIVGGFNELILQAIERDEVARLAELTPAASLLVRSVIDGTVGSAD